MIKSSGYYSHFEPSRFIFCSTMPLAPCFVWIFQLNDDNNSFIAALKVIRISHLN